MSEILNRDEIDHFIIKGFIRIDNAFSQEIADAVINTLWNDLPCERNDPNTWTEPVIRLGMYPQEKFVESINSERMHQIFDQLIGPGKWIPCRSVGTFPVRFPSNIIPNDIGKHVDVSFPGKDPSNYFEWRSNVWSKGRALLMLILYSDVSVNDAPTVIYEGSHLDVAKLLSKEGEQGLSFIEIANRLDQQPNRKEINAIGKAGTIYLCHPFLVHSAQPHRGANPKFMAQPPLLLKHELTISKTSEGLSPVEEAIRLALSQASNR